MVSITLLVDLIIITLVGSAFLLKSPALLMSSVKEIFWSITLKVPGFATSPRIETLKFKIFVVTLGFFTYSSNFIFIDSESEAQVNPIAFTLPRNGISISPELSTR